MLGAIAGDVIGSAYEAGGYKNYDFVLFSEYSRFTDDTVMTVAIASAILDRRDYADAMVELGRRHPLAGYGKAFQEWLFAPEIGPYNSWGNGSAMRVSPIGYAGTSEDWVLKEAERTAEVTHNHPEGIRGADPGAKLEVVSDSASGHLHRAGPDRELPRTRFAIARDHRVIVLVAGVAMSIQVRLDFESECAVQHPLRSCQAELVQRVPRLRVFSFGMDLDYILRRWRVLVWWPQAPGKRR